MVNAALAAPGKRLETGRGKTQAQGERIRGELDDTLLEEGVREILAEHGGDAREAIRSLLRTVSYPEKATGP